MEIGFQVKRLITSFNIEAKDGSFALDAAPLQFETCRERFAKSFSSVVEGFYYKHKPDGGRNVAAFLLRTEEVLREKTYSTFAETNRESILWVEPSNFWRRCSMRRSLLTILLRCGILYDVERDNYEEALFNQEYVIPTRRAVMRFLYGFTRYRSPELASDSTIQVRGWKSVFESKGESDIKEMLVWPDGSAFTPTTEMPNALWI